MAENLGIVGSGAIARGLARVAADHHQVYVWARSEPSAERARAHVEDAAEVTTELEDLSGCDVVIESVIEDLEVKSDMLERLGERLPASALIASTTSSLNIEQLAQASGRPHRFVGFHVFNPVERMDLVELAFPDAADEDTRRRAVELCEVLGKTPVEVPAKPGFVVNRLLFPYLFDAVRLLERDRLEPEAVDQCMKLGAGHPMGPLAVLDFVGLDVAAAIGGSIGEEVPPRVHELIEQGRLGKKSGAGFYNY